MNAFFISRPNPDIGVSISWRFNVSYFQLKCFSYSLYLNLIWFMRRNFGIKAYGIGWVATKIGSEYDFMFHGVPFRFVPSASRSYCLLPGGIANEPETHLFLEKVLENRADVLFVDVGASIGEFAIPMAHDPRICKVIAFEPHPESNKALSESAKQVPNGKLVIVQKGVGASEGVAKFSLSMNSPTAAGIHDLHGQGGSAEIQICALDDALQAETNQPAILMIDIEGGELDALKGGIKFIRTNQPLIIFEYNLVTEKFFLLDQAAQFLGNDYRIYRLRHAHYKGNQSSEAGCLDADLSTTWNVVALPASGPWKNLAGQKNLFISKAANHLDSIST
jgi:FkbM family methyltransferase